MEQGNNTVASASTEARNLLLWPTDTRLQALDHLAKLDGVDERVKKLMCNFYSRLINVFFMRYENAQKLGESLSVSRDNEDSLPEFLAKWAKIINKDFVEMVEKCDKNEKDEMVNEEEVYVGHINAMIHLFKDERLYDYGPMIYYDLDLHEFVTKDQIVILNTVSAHFKMLQVELKDLIDDLDV